MRDVINAEVENQKLMEQIKSLQQEREALGKPKFETGPIDIDSGALQALLASIREATIRSGVLLEGRERARKRALLNIYDKLKTGELLAMGFKDPLGLNPKQQIIPAEYWRFLKFSSDYLEAEGKGIKYTAIIVAR